MNTSDHNNKTVAGNSALCIYYIPRGLKNQNKRQLSSENGSGSSHKSSLSILMSSFQPPNKKLHLAIETPEASESEDEQAAVNGEGEEDDLDLFLDGEGSNVEEPPQNEIQVEFEARTPESFDASGIASLLSKLFDHPSSVDLSELTQRIVDQRSVGSVISQSREDSDDEEEEQEGGSGEPDVFGVTTVIRLAPQGDDGLADAIRTFLLSLASPDGSGSSPGAERRKKLEEVLVNPERRPALLVSERIMNIPPQISVPLYETLFNEVRKAKAKRLQPPFDFTHFVLVARCKLILDVGDDDDDDDDDDTENNKEGGAADPSSNQLEYVNAEEEILEGLAEMVIDVEPVSKDDGDDGQGGKKERRRRKKPKRFDLSQKAYESCKKVIVLRADRAEQYVDALKNEFPI